MVLQRGAAPTKLNSGGTIVDIYSVAYDFITYLPTCPLFNVQYMHLVCLILVSMKESLYIYIFSTYTVTCTANVLYTAALKSLWY